MIDPDTSLLPITEGGRRLIAEVVGFEEESIEELVTLLKTLDVDVQNRFQVVLRRIMPATYLAEGKLKEIQTSVQAHGAHIVVVDVDLSPKQLKNLEKFFERPVLDRPGVILEIFSKHARSKEAKTQVQLAKLHYLLPRLTHFWTHFERQRGGIGLKGMGEKQLEVDRRIIKEKMKRLKDRLKTVAQERSLRRHGRQEILKVALVGYTNAGKSTLLNALTHSNVRAENKLFATLDSNVRALDPDSHPPVVAIDTVGFIRNLPPSLIASFRSTLEELYHSDLLLHVVDASSDQAREQLEVTQKILEDLQLHEKPMITVLNKVDCIPNGKLANWARVVSPGALRISALNAEDVKNLRDKILSHFKKGLELVELLVPYGLSRLESQLHALGSVEAVRYLGRGTFYRVRISLGWIKKLGLEKYRL